jgi:putative flippase GtrA
VTAQEVPRRGGWVSRLWSRRAAVLLGRNTVVSTTAFLLGLGLLWVLVEQVHMNKLLAAGITFLLANTLQYALARTWIFKGTERGVLPGYGFFLFNAALGLAITVGLFAAFIEYTGVHNLAARVHVSVVAGLVMFLMNAVLNFRRL